MNPLNSRSESGARSGFARRIARVCCGFALVSLAVVSRGAAQTPPPGRVPTAGTNAQAGPAFSGAGMLEKLWPGHPDSLAMVIDIIVKGDHLQGHRRLVSQGSTADPVRLGSRSYSLGQGWKWISEPRRVSRERERSCSPRPWA